MSDVGRLPLPSSYEGLHAEIARLLAALDEANTERDMAMRMHNVQFDRANRIEVERDRAVAQVEELSLRIETARYWVDRHRSKWGGLTIELDCIQDGLNGTPSGVRDEVASDLARTVLAGTENNGDSE